MIASESSFSSFVFHPRQILLPTNISSSHTYGRTWIFRKAQKNFPVSFLLNLWPAIRNVVVVVFFLSFLFDGVRFPLSCLLAGRLLCWDENLWKKILSLAFHTRMYVYNVLRARTHLPFLLSAWLVWCRLKSPSFFFSYFWRKNPPFEWSDERRAGRPDGLV